MTISFIIPSINRETLHRTIDSIEIWSGDEIIVEFDIPKSVGWGNAQRNKGIGRATTDYLAFIDDDDYYVVGHRQIMENAIKENIGKPNLFRIKYPSGMILWKTKEIIPGNVSTQMILIPNKKEMLSEFWKKRNMGDFIFIDQWKWLDQEVIWREEIICHMGHDDNTKII